MSEAKAASWALPDFLEWERRQDRRYEPVAGRAVMTAGGTQAHALIAANVDAVLRSKLRGSPCRLVGSDLRVPVPAIGKVRYPDVTIDCGRFDSSAHDAGEPRVVIEILSQSTGWYDRIRKLRDYERVAAVAQYVCISQSEPRVGLWLRGDDGRFVQQDDRLDGPFQLNLGDRSITLTFSEIYEGLFFASAANLEAG